MAKPTSKNLKEVIMNKKVLSTLVAIVMVLSLIVPLGSTLKADSAVGSPTSSSGSWSNGSNAYSSNNSYATSYTNNAVETYCNYGFSLGTHIITKVEVGVESYYADEDADIWLALSVSWDGGSTWSAYTSNYLGPTSDPNSVTWFDFTSATTWTPTALNNTNFRVHVKCVTDSAEDYGSDPYLDCYGSGQYLDWIPVRVTYTLPSYTVSFNSEGGSPTPSDQAIAPGGLVTKPTDPAKTGYTFNGWYTAASGGSLWNFATNTVTGNMTLYAQQTINQYTLTVNITGNGSVAKDPNQALYNYNTGVKLTPTADPGWHFVSWSGDVPSGHGTDNPLNITMDSNKTITATFSDEYTITSSANSGGSITPLGAVIVKQGADQSFVIQAASGYYVKKIIIDGSDFYATGVYAIQTYPYTYTFKDVEANHTIEVVFASGFLQYKITASTAGIGGTITPSGDVFVNQFGSQSFTITTTPDDYYIADVKVDGVSVTVTNPTSMIYTFNTVMANHTIEAFFGLYPQLINITPDGHPDGGESLTPGVISNISFTLLGSVPADLYYFVAYYTVDGGASWETVSDSSGNPIYLLYVSGQTNYSIPWYVPVRYSTIAKVIVYGMDASNKMLAFDTSDDFFKIADVAHPGTYIVNITAPTAGQTVTPGTDFTITWSSSGGVPADLSYFVVFVSYLDGRNGSWHNLCNEQHLYPLAAATSYIWHVPSAIRSDSVKIVVYPMDNSNYLMGNSTPIVFKVLPPAYSFTLSLTHPLSGENLTALSNYNIQWTTANEPTELVGFFFYLSVDDGISWEILRTSDSPASPPLFVAKGLSPYSYSWTVWKRISHAQLMVVATDSNNISSYNVLGITTSGMFNIVP
jgi:uncharacterized repeat protein (TIGR02543 family)